jgi:hypothetical protein
VIRLSKAIAACWKAEMLPQTLSHRVTGVWNIVNMIVYGSNVVHRYRCSSINAEIHVRLPGNSHICWRFLCPGAILPSEHVLAGFILERRFSLPVSCREELILVMGHKLALKVIGNIVVHP